MHEYVPLANVTPSFGGFARSVGLAKIHSNGQPDAAFGVGGVDTSLASGEFQGCNDMALGAENKIVIAGYRYAGEVSSYLTARYTNSAVKIAGSESQNTLNNLSVFPNPLTNDFMTIQFDLMNESALKLEIFDLGGKLVSSRDEGFLSKGNHSLYLSIAGLETGNYIMRLKSGVTSQTIKIQKAE